MPPPPVAASPVASASGPDALATLQHAAMRCGGCGSKVRTHTAYLYVRRYNVCLSACLSLALQPPCPWPQVGATVLSRVLKQLQVPHHDDVITGLESPDDAAVVRPPRPGYVSVHTVDYFRNFLTDPYTFGRVWSIAAIDWVRHDIRINSP
jgi:selenide, water dikinase